MTILVTGAAGFIGSHLCEALAARGHEVTGLDCFAPYYERWRKELNAADLAAAGVAIRELDLAADDLAPAVAEAEVIYHCAAQPGIASHVPLATYVRNNITATGRLLEAVEAAGRAELFVNVATSSIYGRHATDDEETPPKPTSHYGVTKLAAEQLVLAAWRERRLPACSLRLFSVYGPRERPEKLFPKLLESLFLEEEFPLYRGSRQHRRSYTYVDDIVAGFLAVLEHRGVARGEIFNIGTDIEITTGEGMSIAEQLSGRALRVRELPPRPGDQLHTHADIAKARRLLGYEAPTTPQEGLARTVAWFRERLLPELQRRRPGG